jgi:hypothetical protein
VVKGGEVVLEWKGTICQGVPFGVVVNYCVYWYRFYGVEVGMWNTECVENMGECG